MKAETAYLIKQVERHGREEGNPWSIRQMGIYHRSDISSGDVFIIINPTTSLKQRLKQYRQIVSNTSTRALHTIILSCAMENWRFYITDLEKRYLEMVGFLLLHWRHKLRCIEKQGATYPNGREGRTRRIDCRRALRRHTGDTSYPGQVPATISCIHHQPNHSTRH